ncbi:MAG: PDZ domain-containing protein [Phycisphaerales bacterium]|nr:PDZ domain-containing protein [Phycisphaerales bacterium]
MRRSVGVRAVGAILWVAPAIPVLAQHAPPTSLNLDRLVANLDADDPWSRQEASTTLIAGVFPLKEIEGQLGRTDLSAEQRHRLMTVAASLFFMEPRAAMGISLAGVPGIDQDDPAAYIASTEPGFDSQRVLRPEDRLDFLDGQRVRSKQHAIDIIQSHDPGDTISMEVFRNGQVLPLTVRLGSRNELPGGGGGATPLSGRAWQIRSAGYTSATRIVDSTAGPEAWLPLPNDPRRFVGPVAPGAVAGGEARTVPQEPMAVRNPDRRGPRVVRAAPPDDRAQLVMRSTERAQWQRQLTSLTQRLENGNLGEQQRRAIEMNAADAVRALAALDAEIARLTARLQGR